MTQLVSSILGDSEDVHTVSVNVKGQHGVEDDVFLSLPAILEVNCLVCGVEGVIFDVSGGRSDWDHKAQPG